MKRIIVLFLCLILSCSFVACSDGIAVDQGNDSETVTTMHNFSLNKSEVSLEINDTFEIVAAYGQEEITYSVEDADIASVSKTGLVTALKEGVTYVIISAGEESRICKINVVKFQYAVKLDIEESVNVTVGTVLCFSAKSYRDEEQYDGKISWTATGGSITSDGAKVTFTATQKGVYTVTATSEKGATAFCVITVGEALSDFQG